MAQVGYISVLYICHKEHTERNSGDATQATWIAIEMEEMSQLLRNTLSHDDKDSKKDAGHEFTDAKLRQHVLCYFRLI